MADNEKWFKFFVYLPKITAIVMSIIFFIFGILDVAELSILETDAAIIIWWLIGAVVSALAYVLLKLSCSYKILHIYLLKKIEKNN